MQEKKQMKKDYVCKGCNKKYEETSILRHISHKKSCWDAYTCDQIKELEDLAEERKRLKEIDYRKENKSSKAVNDAKRYNKKAKEKREINEELTDTCKSCKKKFWHTSILRHISHKESCRDEYTKEQYEFLEGWAKERKRLNEIDYREENKESIAARRSQRNTKKREERKERRREEIHAEHIRITKSIVRNNKVLHERNARIDNKIYFDASKRNFSSLFQTFQTFELSEKDLQTIAKFESKLQETFNKFEHEIDKVVKMSKELDENIDPDDCLHKLRPLWSTLMNPNYLIRNEWHELTLSIDLTLAKIAKKSKRPYEWADTCFCEKCKKAKNINTKEEKRLREKNLAKCFALGLCPKIP